VEALYARAALAGLNGAGSETSLLAVRQGEDQKTPPRLALIQTPPSQRRLSVFCDRGPRRRGGGDMAGIFAAPPGCGVSPWFRCPPVLAMVDAAILVARRGEPPVARTCRRLPPARLVLIDRAPGPACRPREFRREAEVIKYGVIGDAELFAA